MFEPRRFPYQFPPPFASAWGDDAYGLWAELGSNDPQDIGVHRLRWIEPGSFLMGSREDEPGRYSNEGPQHRVTLTAGFWLADTCCTQPLWAGLMLVEPDSIHEQPAHNVSWREVQEFLRLLSIALGDCEALLPTEAQWEYACRAGTTTAFNCGDSITQQSANFDHRPVHDGTARYDGARTHGKPSTAPMPVKSFPPNAWGLYEMHGNVWEWCADGLRRYAAEPVVDPVGPMDDPATPRVTRGGSWFRSARGVRSADRVFNPTDLRRPDIGFRFVLRPSV